MTTDNLRAPFFPNKSPIKNINRNIKSSIVERNDFSRKNELDTLSKSHAKVSIDNKIKDFARFKKAVDNTPEMDRSEYLENLRNKIKSGQYSIDPEKIAENMILNEF